MQVKRHLLIELLSNKLLVGQRGDKRHFHRSGCSTLALLRRVFWAGLGAIVALSNGLISTGFGSETSVLTTSMVQESGNTTTDEKPLVDQEPFDVLLLDQLNEFAQLKVLPIKKTAFALNLPVPEKPFDFNDQGTLKFQLVEFEEKYWQVPWRNLEGVKLFEDLLLEEANTLLNAAKYDVCFRTLLYLKNYSSMSNSIELRQLFDRCLSEDGRQAMAEGRFDDALSVYEELYFRNPRFISAGRTALEIVSECYERLIEIEVDRRDFLRAQNIITIVLRKYGDRMADILMKWNRRIDEAAIEELGRVREVMAENNSDAAHVAVRRLVHVLPKLREGHEMFKELAEQFPHVYVGVTQPAHDINPNRVFDWASRRVGRLTHRWLFEFNGLTDEGGDYEFPNGSFYRIDDLGLKYRFELRDDHQRFGVPPVTTYQISNRLLELAEIDHPDYYIPWARILKSVEIESDTSVLVELNSPYVRPEAMLQVSYMQTSSDQYRVPNGKYKTANQQGMDRVFVLNEMHAPIPGNQHPTIVERVYKSASAAGEALIRGEVDIVDRIYPADYSRLMRHPDIEVRPYGIPTMHLLIPNPRNLHMKSVNFRRGLTYALDRKALVLEYISMGRVIQGFEPTSGPFPPGSDKTEEISYGVNPTIRPRPESNKLALVLAALVESQEKNRIRAEREREKAREMAGLIEPSEPEPVPAENGTDQADSGTEQATEDSPTPQQEPEIVVERPTFVLAYPDNELVENLCRSMAEKWAIIDIQVTLRKLDPGVLVPDDDDYDLLFMEIFMQEPMVDCYQLFGNQGVAPNVDATIKQSLWMLDRANSWSAVAAALRRIHQQSFNNMTIIPLWQIIDHYAYQKHVSNIGTDNIHLYQNVEHWHFEPLIPDWEEEE